jgi:hypothetical protein
MMTSSGLGVMAAENPGQGKVVLERTIAQGAQAAASPSC